jgi:hypothetical protein
MDDLIDDLEPWLTQLIGFSETARLAEIGLVVADGHNFTPRAHLS